MLMVEAHIETEQSSRYLVRLCTHAASMGRAQGHGPRVHVNEANSRGEVDVQAKCSDTRGTVTFSPWGRCEIAATTSALVLRIEASDEEYLQRIQDIVTSDLDRFSGSEKLAIRWRRTDAAPNVARGEGPKS
jgi:hypothetical protein